MSKTNVELCKEKLSGIGFEKFGDDDIMFFTAPIRKQDLENTLDRLTPDHFEANGYRSVFIGTTFENHFYATSDIRGTFRGYRCKNSYEDYDVSNIFGSGKTLTKCLDNFIDNYLNMKYNIMGE